jgi:hypothetical protein
MISPKRYQKLTRLLLPLQQSPKISLVQCLRLSAAQRFAIQRRKESTDASFTVGRCTSVSSRLSSVSVDLLSRTLHFHLKMKISELIASCGGTRIVELRAD